MFEILWNLSQEQKILKANAKSQKIKEEVAQNKTSTEFDRSRVDRLALAALALYEVLEEKGIITKEEVLSKANEIDMRDGVKDGKYKMGPITCQCGQTYSSKHSACLYCGAKREDGPFERV